MMNESRLGGLHFGCKIRKVYENSCNGSGWKPKEPALEITIYHKA